MKKNIDIVLKNLLFFFCCKIIQRKLKNNEKMKVVSFRKFYVYFNEIIIFKFNEIVSEIRAKTKRNLWVDIFMFCYIFLSLANFPQHLKIEHSYYQKAEKISYPML